MAKNALRFLDLDDVHIPRLHPDLLDKSAGVHQYVNYMLDRTNKMFEWKNLPETIPARVLETYLQINGYAAFVYVESQLPIPFPVDRTFKPGVYIFFGGIGGERDIYYRPTTFIASNPRLSQSLHCPIIYDLDSVSESLPDSCVIMRNDSNYMGLLPLFSRYAAQMVENDISIRSAQINARAQVGISVNSNNDAETARKYLDDLEAGKLGILGKTAFLDGISVANVGTQSANVIIQLIELQQYLKASWFNELGLNANFNMKREYISREEIGSQTDVLLPLVDDMLECRKRACEIINALFDLNISVEKNSAWADKDQTILNSLGAGALEGNMPLIGDVADRVEEDTNVQFTGDSEAVNAGGDSGEESVDRNEPEAETKSGPETDVQESSPEDVSGPEEVTVNVNIIVEGGESDVEQTQEESEESDAE